MFIIRAGICFWLGLAEQLALDEAENTEGGRAKEERGAGRQQRNARREWREHNLPGGQRGGNGPADHEILEGLFDAALFLLRLFILDFDRIAIGGLGELEARKDVAAPQAFGLALCLAACGGRLLRLLRGLSRLYDTHEPVLLLKNLWCYPHKNHTSGFCASGGAGIFA